MCCLNTEMTMKSTKIQRTGKQPAQFKLEDGAYSRKNDKGRWVKLDENYPEHAAAIRAAKAALSGAGKTLKVQRDDSGVGHKWVDVDLESNPSEGGVADEISAWISEEKPEAGATYRATNGMKYRVVKG